MCETRRPRISRQFHCVLENCSTPQNIRPGGQPRDKITMLWFRFAVDIAFGNKRSVRLVLCQGDIFSFEPLEFAIIVFDGPVQNRMFWIFFFFFSRFLYPALTRELTVIHLKSTSSKYSAILKRILTFTYYVSHEKICQHPSRNQTSNCNNNSKLTAPTKTHYKYISNLAAMVRLLFTSTHRLMTCQEYRLRDGNRYSSTARK